MGRKPKEFDKSKFEYMCGLQAKKQWICDELDTTYKTVNAWCKRTYKADFSTVYEQKAAKGKIAILQAQFKMAQEKPAMAIWWGKQYLGQSDKQEIEVTNNEPVIKEMEAYFADKKRNS